MAEQDSWFGGSCDGDCKHGKAVKLLGELVLCHLCYLQQTTHIVCPLCKDWAETTEVVGVKSRYGWIDCHDECSHNMVLINRYNTPFSQRESLYDL